MKNSKKKPVSQPLDNLTVEEAIIKCAQLKIDKSKIPLLLSGKISKAEQQQLLVNLETPNTEEYMLYAKGSAEGELKIASDLADLVGNVKAKDAYKNMSAEQRRQEINRVLQENFGIGLDN